MQPIPTSEYFYSNKIALISIQALEEVMGKNGLNAIFNLAHLSHLVDHYPPDNLEKEFNFADFSAINGALEEMYGSRGGRGLALRAGRSAFAESLRTFGAMAGVNDMAFKLLPLQVKLRIGVPAIAKIFSQTSDQYSTVEEKDTEFIFTIHRCPICWGRTADTPICFLATGLLQGGLTWISGGFEFRINESKCIAVGNEVCEFTIQKKPLE